MAQRLIDANALKETVCTHDYILKDCFNSIDKGMFTLGIMYAIDEQPTVDAVHVIRCRDCKFHCDRTRCKKRIGAWFDDDYCNGAVMAERKEK